MQTVVIFVHFAVLSYWIITSIPTKPFRNERFIWWRSHIDQYGWKPRMCFMI